MKGSTFNFSFDPGSPGGLSQKSTNLTWAMCTQQFAFIILKAHNTETHTTYNKLHHTHRREQNISDVLIMFLQ